MTRAEHVRWCKERARKYLRAGDAQQAVTSMLSDLGKHDATARLAETVGMIGIMSARSLADAQRFVEDFTE